MAHALLAAVVAVLLVVGGCGGDAGAPGGDADGSVGEGADGGRAEAAVPGGDGACTPETEEEMCARLGYECGQPQYDLDNCQAPRQPSCGTCTSPASCGGGGTKYVCGSGPCEEGTAPLGVWEPLDAQTTEDLNAVWADEAGTAWVVGNGGTLRWWSGGVVTAPGAPTTGNLHAVFGIDQTHVWLAGADHAVYFWDGAAFSALDAGLIKGPINGLWASGVDDVWAVGSDSETGTTFHWNGAAWTFLPTGSDMQAKVFGVAGEMVWATTFEGEVLAFGADTWTSWGLVGMAGLWGTSAVDLWLIDGYLMHRVVDVWYFVADGRLPYQLLVDGRGLSASDLWAVGYAYYWFGDDRVCGLVRHWDGRDWSLVENQIPAPLHGVWATPTEVWTVGASGTVRRLAR